MDVKLILVGLTVIFTVSCLFFGTKNGFYDSDNYDGNGSAHWKKYKLRFLAIETFKVKTAPKQKPLALDFLKKIFLAKKVFWFAIVHLGQTASLVLPILGMGANCRINSDKIWG